MEYKITEWCSLCNTEEDYILDLENKNKISVQTCKNCGEPIIMCGACTEANCKDCDSEASGFILEPALTKSVVK